MCSFHRYWSGVHCLSGGDRADAAESARCRHLLHDAHHSRPRISGQSRQRAIAYHAIENSHVALLCVQFPSMECLMTGICDEFPRLRKYKTWLTLGACVTLFLLGLPCVTEVRLNSTSQNVASVGCSYEVLSWL